MYRININGRITDEGEAHISVLDRGLLYGDSVYEVSLGRAGKILFLEEHLDRLQHSASMIGMNIAAKRQGLKKEMFRTLAAHGGEYCYIRPIITRGSGVIDLDPAAGGPYNVIIIVKDLAENPKEWYEKGVSLSVTRVIRNPVGAIDPNIKSGNYLNNMLALREAKKKGAFDAIMLNAKGLVTESTTSNLWMVRDGVFYTPALGMLEGITRRMLFNVCEKKGLKACEREFTASEMKEAQECFLTSTIKELVPITKIDGEVIGDGRPGKWTRELHRHYRAALHYSGPTRRG